MKKAIMILMLCGLTAPSFSQTWNEWFRQKRTQLRYLGEQIAALKVYGELIEDGYAIAKDGLKVINDIKHGDFNLHNEYFNSFLRVNPAISKYIKAMDSYLLFERINKQIKATKKVIQLENLDEHATYAKAVLENFENHVLDNLEQFRLLSSDGNYSLTDDERLNRIDAVYAVAADQYDFIQNFYQAIISIAANRQLDVENIRILEKMYDLKYK